MIFTILIRIQGALIRMGAPFLFPLIFAAEVSSEFIYIWGVALAASGVLILGFPQGVNRSLGSKGAAPNEIFYFFVWMVLASILITIPLSIVWKIDLFNFLPALLYFSTSHVVIALERVSQYFDNNGWPYFLLNSCLFISILFAGSLVSDPVLFVYYSLFAVNVFGIFIFLIKTRFWNGLKFLALLSFFKSTIPIGSYSILQNITSRLDVFIAPLVFGEKIFVSYYLASRFVDAGNFLVATYSQINLVGCYKKKKPPVISVYFKISIIALFLALFSYCIYIQVYLELEFWVLSFFAFALIPSKAIVLGFQDSLIYHGKDRLILMAQFWVAVYSIITIYPVFLLLGVFGGLINGIISSCIFIILLKNEIKIIKLSGNKY